MTDVSLVINHRAKRGGSLFQGGSGGEERLRSHPLHGGEAPPSWSRSDFNLYGGVALRSLVCDRKVALNIDGLG